MRAYTCDGPTLGKNPKTGKMQRIIRIPFSGFYESFWSGIVDNAVENEAYNLSETEREEQDKRVALDESEIGSVLWEYVNYSACYREIAEDIVAMAGGFLREDCGIKGARITFESMTSPRFYNFETDRVFGFITVATIRAMWAVSKRDDHDTLKDVIRRDFTDYDGFCSSYDNTLATWPRDPLEWDHNQLATLFKAVCKIECNVDDWERCLMQADFDVWQVLDRNLDYAGLRAKLDEMRDDKAIEAGLADPRPKRCPLTMDLFDGGQNV